MRGSRLAFSPGRAVLGDMHRGMCRSRVVLSLAFTLAAMSAAAGCGGDDDDDGDDGAVGADSGSGEGADAGVDGVDAAPVACATVREDWMVIGTASGEDDYALELPARSASATRWEEVDNEALILDVSGSERGVIGQLVMHQGQALFSYGMSLGRLAAGEQVSVAISTMSAMSATREACVGPAVLTPAAELGDAADGLINAPAFRWPAAKRFDDLPVLVGWSAARRAYQAVYTTEDGGTVEQCGGGSDGIQAEIARWGRACDIEGMFSYGDAPRWGRCTGSTPFSTVTPVLDGTHPIFYYGDGHNRLFESRGGYGETCGGGGPEKADGDLVGWNVENPGNGPELDGDLVITVRPLPVALDPIGYAEFGGRREGLLDSYAPWVYRLTFLELAREDKIDGELSFPLEQYLYVDVHIADVDGSGDRECSLSVSGGFMVRAVTAGGETIEGPQMTQSYAGSGNDWKRLAIPVPAGTTAADIDHLVFDAYDDDGIYLLGLGDAFLVQPDGEAGAVLDYVHQGDLPLAFYVDDDTSSCTGGVNTDGPGGLPYACAGTLVEVDPRAPADP